ncbi:Tryptophan 2,3-dioxygenase [alpha proteobacterium BAL199]|jgi:tryptophan 2,3-dioxygenase|nr:Tryptophan 2,3-dioxygenase [alpha proteobacterium BAL199]
MAKGTDRPATLAKRRSYADFLELDTLLGLQHSFADSDDDLLHNELLFVIIHQADELWLKLLIHETRLARSQIAADRIAQTPKVLTRMRRVLEQLSHAWDVLSTMTPVDYLTFRDRLGSGSGLQSAQYREFEFLLGGRDRSKVDLHRDRPTVAGRLEATLAEPSLYDEVLRLLARRGFAIPQQCRDRDWTIEHQPSAEVRAAWVQLYRNVEAHWDLYELAEKLVDLEHMLDIWRHHHASTVERVIGFKQGTGGTSGVGYLRQAVFRRFFPDLWECRTEL